MEFKLRIAEEKDIPFLYEWRNDKEVRNNALTSNIISYPEFEAYIKFNNSIKLVFEYNMDPAGFVSFSRDEDSGEWAFHMPDKYRGKGLSEIMLKAALHYIKHEEGYNHIYSSVHFHNKVSKHLHDKLGFEVTDNNNNMYKLYLML